MEELDIYKRANSYEKELKRLENAVISANNKECITKYCEFMSAKGCGEVRIVKLSTQLRKIAALLNKDFDTVEKSDITSLLARINREGMGVQRLTAKDKNKIKEPKRIVYSRNITGNKHEYKT